MSAGLYRLGQFTVKRAPFVVLAWLVLAVALVLIANAGGRPTDNDLSLPGTGSTQAQDLLDAKLPQQANGSVPIVIETKKGSLTSGSNQTAVENAYKSLKKNKYVSDALSPYTDEGAADISKNGKIVYIPVALTVGSGDLDVDEANSVLDAADPAKKADLEVSAGGYLGQELSSPGTELSEVIGVLAAFVILLFAFRTFASAPLPLVSAIVALISGLAAIGIFGQIINVPTIAPTLAIMLGLGVGVDYSLFIITRHLRLLRDGVAPEESIPRSLATSGSAVVFAGTTVMLALICLYFSGIPLVRDLGYMTAVAVLFAVLAAITFLPAVLGLLGKRILAGPFKLFARKSEEGVHGFARWANVIQKHPLISAAIGIVILAALAVPALDMKLGAPDYGQLPKDTTERQSYDGLTSGFGVGTNGPLLIAVDLNPPAKPDTADLQKAEQQQSEAQQQQAAAQEQATEAQQEAKETDSSEAQQQSQEANQQLDQANQQLDQANQQVNYLSSPASDTRLQSLENAIKKQDNVQSVSYAQTNKSGSAAVFSVTPKTSPSAYTTQNVVNHLRDDTIPANTKGTGLTAYVGGTTAGYIDLAAKISDKLALVIGIVVLLSCLLLIVAFRTLIVPITSALLNLLAVLAAYGVLTSVFQNGHGLSLLGLEHTMPVVSYVPLMMFAILFGLSMDYQVFMVSRIDEAHGGGKANREAVNIGVASGGRVILAAATIMFLVFFSFVINGDPIVKQFGVGLAVAVAIDALVVLLIVPSLMTMIGEPNWWLPRWLSRIVPDIGLEGDPSLKKKA